MKYYICAIIKDEHLFLKEWINYHLEIGFEHITLYEDFTSKSHKEIINGNDKITLLSMNNIPECKEGKTSRQIACYNDFLKTHKEGWCAFIDIDEFFKLEEGYTLDKLTKEYSDIDGLCLWWKCYGANGHINRPMLEDGTSPVQESYKGDLIKCNDYWQFKSFVNLNKSQNKFINCHFYKSVCYFNRKTIGFNYDKKYISYSPAWIDHYITKSWEDWQARLKRGNISKGLRNEKLFFALNPNMKDKCSINYDSRRT